MTRYYIGTIHERNSDFEYETKYLFETAKDPDLYTRLVAMTWRGGEEEDWDESHDGFWSEGTLIHDYGSTEIPRSDYMILKKYLSVL